MTDQTTEAVAADPAAPQTQEPAAPATEATEPTAEASTEAAGEESAPSQESGESSTDEGKPKKQGGFQKRIDQLTRDNYLLKAQLQQVQAKPAPQQAGQQAAQASGEEPKLENFGTIDEFLSAHREWAKNEGFKQATEEAKKQFEQQQATERLKAVKAQIDAREAQARTKYKDYDDIVSPFAPILMGNPVLAEYIASEDMGAEVAYHLARNPAVLEELSGLSEFAAGRKLLELEARLKAPPPPKPVTNAPDPIKPVGARETVTKTLGDLAQSDDAGAYIKKANQLRRK
jgi:hypothetical protein